MCTEIKNEGSVGIGEINRILLVAVGFYLD